MQRATLTLVQDSAHVVARLAVGDALDLVPGERNIVGRRVAAGAGQGPGGVAPPARVTLDDDAKDAHALGVTLGRDGWRVGAFGAGVVVAGADGIGEAMPSRAGDGAGALAGCPPARAALDNGGSAPLAHGTLLGWPRLGVLFRFDVVAGGLVERRFRVRGTDTLLLDCAAPGPRVPGRWPALRLLNDRVVRAHAVAGPADASLRWLSEGYDRERGLSSTWRPAAPEPRARFPEERARHERDGLAFRVFDAVDGVPLRVLADRVDTLEPVHALGIAAGAASFIAGHLSVLPVTLPVHIDADCFCVTWDGELALLPQLQPQPTRTNDGRGVVAELLARLLPAGSPWLDERARPGDAAHAAVVEVVGGAWREVGERYLRELEAPQPAQQRTMAATAQLLHDACARLRELSAEPAASLADVVRNVCPRSWQAELQLREELDVLDDAGRRALYE